MHGLEALDLGLEAARLVVVLLTLPAEHPPQVEFALLLVKLGGPQRLLQPLDLGGVPDHHLMHLATERLDGTLAIDPRHHQLRLQPRLRLRRQLGHVGEVAPQAVGARRLLGAQESELGAEGGAVDAVGVPRGLERLREPHNLGAERLVVVGQNPLLLLRLRPQRRGLEARLLE